MSKQYDQKTKDKLYKLYNEVITKTSIENKNLTSQLNDLKATLELNHKLLFSFLDTSQLDEKVKNDIIEKREDLWEKIEYLITLKKDMDIRIYILQSFIENIPIQINEEINNIANKINETKNELFQKDNMVKKLKQDLEKARKSALFKEARTEVFVSGPTKYNLEKNQELIIVKSILPKVSLKHSNAEKTAKKLEKELYNLKDELKRIKKKDEQSFNNEILSKIKGYNISAESMADEKSYEEEEEKESSEENSSEEGKSMKKKKKELDQLNDKYNELKKSYQNYQDKINEYKKSYKTLKEKMGNIYNSVKK